MAIFDPSGRELLAKKLPSGQGQGDVNFFDFDECKGRYFVWDKAERRLNIFDKGFNLISTSDLRKGGHESRSIMRTDQEGNIYFIYTVMSLSKLGMPAEVGIWNFGKDGSGRRTRYLGIRPKPILLSPSGKSISYFFLGPFLRYQIEDNGNVWACDTSEYKIYKYSADGTLEKSITGQYEKIPIKGKTESKFREIYRVQSSKEAPYGLETILPEYICPIIDFLLIDGKYILVLRMDNMYKENKSGKVLADVFDAEGRFLTHLEVPEFWGCYNLTNQYKSNIFYKNGALFTLETDDGMDRFWISEYDLKIENLAR